MSKSDHRTLITKKSESFEAFEMFKTAFVRGAQLFETNYLVWRGGSVQVPVYWHCSAGIWGVFESKPPRAKRRGNRFWNCFGIADPKKNEKLRITVEINPPHEWKNNLTAAVFLRDEQGCYYVGHSGRLGGSQPGLSQEGFKEFSGQLEWREIETPRGGREVVIFGPLKGDGLPEILAPFIRTVAELKEAVASQN